MRFKLNRNVHRATPTKTTKEITTFVRTPALETFVPSTTNATLMATCGDVVQRKVCIRNSQLRLTTQFSFFSFHV